MANLKRLKIVVKPDCFAFDEGYCRALDARTCDECKFYKNKDAYREENIRLYGVPEPIFRTSECKSSR